MNGDDAVIFPVDAPSIGGLLCLSTFVCADFWRLGQVRPGDTVKLKRISFEQALDLSARIEDFVARVA